MNTDSVTKCLTHDVFTLFMEFNLLVFACQVSESDLVSIETNILSEMFKPDSVAGLNENTFWKYSLGIHCFPGSLTALVCQHSITPLALPCKLILPDRGKQPTPSSRLHFTISVVEGLWLWLRSWLTTTVCI